MHTRVFVSERDRDGNQKILVLFYEARCVFSNFYPAGFTANPVEDEKSESGEMTFNCSEQYFMYRKAMLVGDERIAAQMMRETNPMKIKMLGRQLAMSKEHLEQWSKKSRDAMYKACLAKFAQNQEQRLFLFRTHGMNLVEASPNDRIWGIGLAKEDRRAEKEATWRGTNWLGECLDKVREELWIRPEFAADRLQAESESLETRCQLLENF